MLVEDCMRPSRSHIWGHCAGSVGLMYHVAEPPGSAAASSGTDGHTLSAELFGVPEESREAMAAMLAESPYMARMVLSYVATAEDLGRGSELQLTEMQVKAWEGMTGTADRVYIFPVEIQVHDLKTGRLEVKAEKNTQLLTYAAGVYRFVTEVLGYTPQTVRMFIHQEQCGGVSEWSLPLADFLDEVRKLKAAYDEALRLAHGPKADALAHLVCGNHCTYCPALGICPEVKRAEKKTAERAEALEICAPEDEGAILAEILPRLKLIESYVKAVKLQALQNLKLGKEIPGFKLVQGKKGGRAWIDETEAEKTLKSKRFKKAEMYKSVLLSPAQLEKVVPAKYKKVLDLVHQPEGAPTVAPITDKRPALTVETENGLFNDLTKENV